jgi:hypothetical protein
VNALENRVFRPIAVRILERLVDTHKSPFRIFARTACVGESILARCFRGSRIEKVKFQKLRVDFFLRSLLQSPEHTFFVDDFEEECLELNLDIMIANQMKRSQLAEIKDGFLSSHFALFDSFCELTDRVFLYQRQLHERELSLELIGHAQDFKHLPHGKFLEDSFISTETFFDSWTKVLQFQKTNNSNFPILYLHYSSRNDSRDFYRKRSKQLLGVAKTLSASFSNFHVIAVPEVKYSYFENDYFPYHYSRETQILLSRQLEEVLAAYGIKTSRYVFRID